MALRRQNGNFDYDPPNMRCYTPSEDNLSEVTFKIYEGEDAIAPRNQLLASCSIPGILPGPEGTEHFTVTFEIDEEGDHIDDR